MKLLLSIFVACACSAQSIIPPTNPPSLGSYGRTGAPAPFKFMAKGTVDTNPQPVPALPYIIIAVTNPPFANQCGYNYFASSNGGVSWQLYGSTVDRYFAVSRTNYYSQSLIFKAAAVSNSSVPLFP